MRQTTRLGNAYGVCVILVTFITTCMVSIVALIIWRLHPLIVLAGFLVFSCLDGMYLSSALTKVPDGAWFTLVLAFVLSSVFILWRFGKEQQWKAEGEDRFQPSHLVKLGEDGEMRLTSAFGGGELTNMKGIISNQSYHPNKPLTASLPTGFGIFFDKVGDMTPIVFIQFLSKFVATPSVTVFFHLRPLSTPSVPDEDRYTIDRTVIPNCYRLTIRHGYMDEVVTEDLAMLIYSQLRDFIIREAAKSASTHPHTATISDAAPAAEKGKAEESASSTASSSSANLAVSASLATLEKAYETQVVYIVGKEQMRIRTKTKIWRRVTLAAFLWLRDNTRSKMSSLNIPVEKLVEVGFVKEV